ncbi:MAG: alpha/beta fold hydrolase [Bacteroidetes bacterium]|nr:alpha/beta fold hydrolase [Bacteroidota bacterium]MBS1929718.1 alpha/beta fold hydrolase [Bacteroidota bacterium]
MPHSSQWRPVAAFCHVAIYGDDDTEAYSEIWANQYDFTRLMRRAFGASRAIDYLYTLPIVDKGKIGLMGHSRNGKTSLWAAAFDDRIKAIISSSGGSGAEIPWRYTSHKYDDEDIALLTCNQPPWLHPRLRFFIGRENKLPVDQNSFMALIAPRGLMLSSAINETEGNPWGIEQAYNATQKIYKFLGAENNLAIRLRPGLHGTRPDDIEAYIDFFEYIFKRNKQKPENKLLFNYSFDNWRKQSKENINPLDFPVRNMDDIEVGVKNKKIQTIDDWNLKKQVIQKNIRWILGKEPPGVTTPGPQSWKNREKGEAYFGHFLDRPTATDRMSVMPIAPYHTFGDYLYGYLYFPKNMEEAVKNGKAKLHVVVYLHEYDYSKGFSSEEFDHDIQPYFESLVDNGFAVFTYDMVGFGNRIEEGSAFYKRYPNWSKMGKCVADLQGALETLTHLDFIDSTKISVVGYSLGATVALYTAALDKRISSVASVCGFTPMRLDTMGKGTEGIRAYSHLHGMLPRLGFFVNNESRIPYDFHEILAAIAPRNLLVIAPVMDQDASLTDIQNCIRQAGKIFNVYGKPGNIQIFTPDDYNRFSPDMRKKTIEWLKELPAL